MSHHALDVPYAQENWTAAEADILRRYFTNLDGPVFALVNLPEVVKGALFARYSRTAKSLRRLFLDEFVGDLDVSGDHGVDATVGLMRAEQLYEKVFFEYGDDSVAQLGGVHLACEQASNLLTKVLERGRLMAYMEKSTRYVAYDTRLPNGRYRYYRSPEVLASPLGARYVGDMDRMFDAYAKLLPVLYEFFAERHPKAGGESDFALRQAIKAKAFDTLRGLLPSSATSNLGMYGSGQGYEALLLRMRAHPLPEARDYADLMLAELRKVIPSWVRRVDVADRGTAWSEYMEKNNSAMVDLASTVFGSDGADDGPAGNVGPSTGDGPDVTLVDWDPDAEVKVVTAMLYPYTHLSEEELARRVGDDRAATNAGNGPLRRRTHQPQAQAGPGPRAQLVPFRRGVGLRGLPGPAAPPSTHDRMAGPAPLYHGYTMPEAVTEAGGAGAYEEAMGRSASLYEALEDHFGATVAAYAVTLAAPRPLQRPDERPGSDAHARAPHDASGPSRVPQGMPEDAPVDSRQGRAPRDRRHDELRRPLRLRRRRARPLAG